MATIILKNSPRSESPTTLEVGEVALSTSQGVLYYKNTSSGDVEPLRGGFTEDARMKLDSIEAGASNDRSKHTGKQDISTINNLEEYLENKPNDAPPDGQPYVRKDGDWVLLNAVRPETFTRVGVVLTFNSAGSGKGIWQQIDENFEPISPSPSYFNYHPIYSQIKTVIIDGQEMIQIPKFYMMSGTCTVEGSYFGKPFWMISDEPAEGFTLHPAFRTVGGGFRDYIWIGKWGGTIADGKMQSVPVATTPVVNVVLQTLSGMAEARNINGVTGFCTIDVHMLSVIQVLATIELGSPDVQSYINMPSVTNIQPVNSEYCIRNSWRGITSLWGNAWYFVDGIQISSTGTFVIRSNDTGNYVDTQQPLPGADGSGYTTSFSLAKGDDFDLSTVFLPASRGTNAAASATSDICYKSGVNKIGVYGGAVGDSLGAGIFCSSFFDSLSSASGVVGCRLARK